MVGGEGRVGVKSEAKTVPSLPIFTKKNIQILISEREISNFSL